ncbi:hypothetical protein D3C77_638030 [compost metagenome]
MRPARSVVDGLQLQLFNFHRITGVCAGPVGLVQIFDLNLSPAGSTTFNISKLQQVHSEPLDTESGTV